MALTLAWSHLGVMFTECSDGSIVDVRYLEKPILTDAVTLLKLEIPSADARKTLHLRTHPAVVGPPVAHQQWCVFLRSRSDGEKRSTCASGYTGITSWKGHAAGKAGALGPNTSDGGNRSTAPNDRRSLKARVDNATHAKITRSIVTVKKGESYNRS